MESQDKRQSRSPAKRLAVTGMLAVFALILGLVESMLPPISSTIPGIKIGLSNIVVLFALEYVNFPAAISIVVIKALFAFITRGVIAGVLSLFGGVIAILVMAAAFKIFNGKISYMGISVLGSVCHNMGQLAVAAFLINIAAVKALIPALLISGVVMGISTGLLYKLISAKAKYMKM